MICSCLKNRLKTLHPSPLFLKKHLKNSKYWLTWVLLKSHYEDVHAYDVITFYIFFIIIIFIHLSIIRSFTLKKIDLNFLSVHEETNSKMWYTLCYARVCTTFFSLFLHEPNKKLWSTLYINSYLIFVLF
jgi:hypothetical protein